MKEPSVLDYLKSRLPWSKNKLDFPTLEAESQGNEQLPAGPSMPEPVREPVVREKLKLPWRSLLALLLALFAQFTLDPEPFSWGSNSASNSLRNTDFQRALYTGLFFYALSACFLIWAYLIKEFTLPSLPEEQPETDRQTVNTRWLVIGGVLCMFAFFLFNNNRFTELNVTLWLAGLALYLRSVWLHRAGQSTVPDPIDEPDSVQPARPFSWYSLIIQWWDVGLLLFVALMGVAGLGGNIFLFGLLPLLIAMLIVWLRDPQAMLTPAQRLKMIIDHDPWQLKVTRWALLILAVAAVIIFFRFYRLDGVPGEPFSDHAEKLLDVSDLIGGQTKIFFERNTGREFLQFYWTALLAYLLNTGLTFLTLKIGTALIGLFALPFVYLLGKELGGRRVGLFALVLAGVAYWPNTISRIGLRFPLYPMFAAPVLFFLMRGLRTQKRNDFILSGLFLGLGLHGYSSFRFMPFVVLAGIAVYLLHKQAQNRRKQVLMMLAIVVVTSFLVFLPLFRYTLEHPDIVTERSLSRLSTGDAQVLPTTDWCPIQGNVGAATCTFLSNTFKASLMFFWDDGNTWVHSVTGRPALDIIAAVLFGFGYCLVLVRYLRLRRWQDLFLLVSVPLLLMPSILSLAFPDENPSLNRTGGAMGMVFIIAAMALDGLYNALRGERSSGLRQKLAVCVVVVMLAVSAAQSYDLVFNQFSTQFLAASWNSSDIGRVVRAFIAAGNSPDNAWVVPFPYWVDTRLTGIASGLPTKDQAVSRDQLPETLSAKGAKLFIVKDEDKDTLTALRKIYPSGLLGLFQSPLEGHNFWIYTVPDNSQSIPSTQ
jgi:MFS family permease